MVSQSPFWGGRFESFSKDSPFQNDDRKKRSFSSASGRGVVVKRDEFFSDKKSDEKKQLHSRSLKFNS